MRVGLVIPSLDGGGAEFVAKRWAEALCLAGCEVFIYTFHPEGGRGSGAPRSVRRHFRLKSTWARWLVFPVWLRHYAQRDQLDVLVSMMTFANLVNVVAQRAARRSSARLILVEHSLPTIGLSSQGGAGIAGQFKKALARLLYRHADAVIGVSHGVVADLVGGYGVAREHAFVVPNPIVSAPKFALAPVPSNLTVAFVGRLVPQKCPNEFVATLAALRRRGIAARGVVIGTGPLLSDIEAHGRELDVPLEFRGWMEPWWRAAKDVECLLLPSLVEGFGNVAVEAAAVGIPSVASSSALGIADAIVPGFTGELVLGHDPEGFADGVLRAVRSRDVDPLIGWLNRFSVETSTNLFLDIMRLARESE